MSRGVNPGVSAQGSSRPGTPGRGTLRTVRGESHEAVRHESSVAVKTTTDALPPRRAARINNWGKKREETRTATAIQLQPRRPHAPQGQQLIQETREGGDTVWGAREI
jgi:hypothetical protein